MYAVLVVQKYDIGICLATSKNLMMNERQHAREVEEVGEY